MFTLRCLVDNKSLDAARFKAEHGVAFAIETSAGWILFDTGQSGTVMVHNAAQMGIDLMKIDALVLSHAHYDHTGGLEAFLKISRPGLHLYAHPDIFRERFSIRDGQTRRIGLRMAQADLAQRAILRLSVEPKQILPGVWTTGEITNRAEFEGRSAHHYIHSGSDWLPDPYRDDMALILESHSGLVVICGCCHAGLLNTLAQVRHMFDREVVAIVGGSHLVFVDDDSLEHVVDVLSLTCVDGLPYLYLNHCTSERALDVLSRALGDKVNPCPAGMVLRFD